MANLKVSDRPPIVQYAPGTHDGETDFWTGPEQAGFVFLDEAHLEVYVDSTLQTITTHYTVTGALDDNGGVVTFPSAPANDTLITILRKTPIERDFDYGAAAGIPSVPKINDQDLNKLTLIFQEQLAQLDRLQRFAPSFVGDPPVVFPDGEADKYLQWDENGVLQNSDDTVVPVTPPASWITDLWNALEDAAAARSLLELGDVAVRNFGYASGEVPNMDLLGNVAFRDHGTLPVNVPLNSDLVQWDLTGQKFFWQTASTLYVWEDDGIVRTAKSGLEHGASGGNNAHPAFGGSSRSALRYETVDLLDSPDTHTFYTLDVDTEAVGDLGSFQVAGDFDAGGDFEPAPHAKLLTIPASGVRADQVLACQLEQSSPGGGYTFLAWNIYRYDEEGLAATEQVVNFLSGLTGLSLGDPQSTVHDANDTPFRGLYYGDEPYFIVTNLGSDYRSAGGDDDGLYFLRCDTLTERLIADPDNKGIDLLLGACFVNPRLYLYYRDEDFNIKFGWVNISDLPIEHTNWVSTERVAHEVQVLFDSASGSGLTDPTNWLMFGVDPAGFHAVYKPGTAGFTNNGVAWWQHEHTTPLGSQELDSTIGTASSARYGLFRVPAEVE